MRSTSTLRRLIVLLVVVLGISHCSTAHAYAWMIKHSFAKCGDCHADPMGGETLNQMGRAQSAYLLSLGGERVQTPGPISQFLFGAGEPADTHLGGSYRQMLLYRASRDGVPSDTQTFPMQADLYGSANLDFLVVGANFGVARNIEGSAHARGAQLNTEEGDGWLLLNRNAFLGLRLDDQTLLRVGRLNLPFGVRIPEHVAWVREATRTDRESDQQHGVALFHSSGRLSFEGMLIAGNFQIYPDRYRERGYSLSAEYLLGPSVAVGVSSLLVRANEDRFTQATRSIRQVHGLTGRFGWASRWSLLTEADLMHGGGREFGYAGFAQADFEPRHGLHFMLTAEALDQGLPRGGGPRSPGNGQPRLGAWGSAACFFLSHLELRLDAVQREESPFTLQGQLHVFL